MNPFVFLFARRIRGFRVIEIAAFACFVCLVFVVYFCKAHAGRETGEIGDIDQQIADTGRRVRLLQAEAARLESPARIERLSERLLNFQPIPASHETPDTGLMEVARQAADPQTTRPDAKAAAFVPSPGPIFTAPGAAPGAGERRSGSNPVSPIDPVGAEDFRDYRQPYGPGQLWRWFTGAVWNIERAFEQSRTSGRAVDDTRLRMFFVLSIFALAFVSLGLKATRAALFVNLGDGGGASSAIAGARADLADRNGVLLAVDLTHYGVYLDPDEIWDSAEIRRKLPLYYPGVPLERLDKALAGHRREYLGGGLTPQEMKVIHDQGLPGVSFEEEPRRVYPLGPLAEHLIGFSDAGGRGIAGAEKALDGDIRDAAGSGQPVELAMDVRVQAALQDELQKAQLKYGTLTAQGMVVNVHTGEVLAMASVPDFDPNAPGRTGIPNLTNHEAASVYELGSVFKAFTIAMGLDTGVVNLDSTFDVHAPIMVGGHLIHDFDKGDSTLALWQVFTHSSNIGAATLAMRAGPDRMRDYFNRFGLFKAAPSELYESARPILPRQFSNETLAQIAFGQGVSVSPMALATGYTSLMNGGLYVPLTIRKADPARPVQGRRVVSEQTSYQMLQLMRMNVHTDPKGSGHKADDVGLRVGGKTGSAQKPEHGHYSKNNVSSFVGVFPTDGPVDADRYLVIVTLDAPHVTPDSYGFITAGWNAAPTVGAVINRIAPFLGVKRIITADAPLPGQAAAKPQDMAE